MNARKKLNNAYTNSALIAAAVGGWLTQSLTIAVVLFALLLAMAFYSGDIRGRRR